MFTAKILAQYEQENKTTEALELFDHLRDELGERTNIYEDFVHETLGRIHRLCGESKRVLDHLKQTLAMIESAGLQRSTP